MGKTARKNYLVHIFFNVVHRTKQLSKGHKLSNRSVYRCKQRLRRVCDATDGGEVDESFAGAAVLTKLLRLSVSQDPPSGDTKDLPLLQSKLPGIIG